MKVKEYLKPWHICFSRAPFASMWNITFKSKTHNFPVSLTPISRHF